MMRAYERLLRYVKVNTTSDPESATHPTTARQFDLANILVEELKELESIGTHAAILGKALYTGRLDLKTVIGEVGAC